MKVTQAIRKYLIILIKKNPNKTEINKIRTDIKGIIYKS